MIAHMRELNIAGLDLNLIPALEALLRLRNVTHAAVAVGLSQPAMSRALGRLREVLGDPLLVRTAGGYVLTPRAQAIQPELALAVRHLRGIFQPEAFDPAAVRRIVRIAATDTQTVLFGPAIMTRLAAEAPGVDLRVEGYGPDIAARLDSGALDFAFALSTTPLGPGASSEPVFDDEVALIMRQGHPASGRPWTLADYAAFSHVGVAVLGDGQTEIDAALAAHDIRRRIALVTPHFMAALATVAGTDMVTTLSAALARRFAAEFQLHLQPPPIGERRLRMTLICSLVRASDPFLIWFRSLVREAASNLA